MEVAGKGGFGDIFIVDENYVVKRVLQNKKGRINPVNN
jgi:serine/threonine protein kinase